MQLHTCKKKKIIKSLLQLHSKVENTIEYPDSLSQNCATSWSMTRLIGCYRDTWWLLHLVHDLPPCHVNLSRVRASTFDCPGCINGYTCTTKHRPNESFLWATLSLNQHNLCNFKFTCKTLCDNRDHSSLISSLTINNFKQSNLFISEISHL